MKHRKKFLEELIQSQPGGVIPRTYFLTKRGNTKGEGLGRKSL